MNIYKVVSLKNCSKDRVNAYYLRALLNVCKLLVGPYLPPGAHDFLQYVVVLGRRDTQAVSKPLARRLRPYTTAAASSAAAAGGGRGGGGRDLCDGKWG